MPSLMEVNTSWVLLVALPSHLSPGLQTGIAHTRHLTPWQGWLWHCVSACTVTPAWNVPALFIFTHSCTVITLTSWRVHVCNWGWHQLGKGSAQPGARRPRRRPWLCSLHRQKGRPFTQCVGDMDWAGCGLELRALLAIPLLCPCVSGSGDRPWVRLNPPFTKVWSCYKGLKGLPLWDSVCPCLWWMLGDLALCTEGCPQRYQPSV